MGIERKGFLSDAEVVEVSAIDRDTSRMRVYLGLRSAGGFSYQLPGTAVCGRWTGYRSRDLYWLVTT